MRPQLFRRIPHCPPLLLAWQSPLLSGPLR